MSVPRSGPLSPVIEAVMTVTASFREKGRKSGVNSSLFALNVKYVYVFILFAERSKLLVDLVFFLSVHSSHTLNVNHVAEEKKHAASVATNNLSQSISYFLGDLHLLSFCFLGQVF